MNKACYFGSKTTQKECEIARAQDGAGLLLQRAFPGVIRGPIASQRNRWTVSFLRRTRAELPACKRPFARSASTAPTRRNGRPTLAPQAGARHARPARSRGALLSAPGPSERRGARPSKKKPSVQGTACRERRWIDAGSLQFSSRFPERRYAGETASGALRNRFPSRACDFTS